MKKLQYRFFVPLLALLVSVSSCDFGDTNIDPTRVDDAAVNLVLPSGIAHLGYNTGAIATRNPGIIMQYFAGTDAQQLGYTQYNFPANTMNNFWGTGMYAGAMKDFNVIMEATNPEVEGSLNAPHYNAIAKILMANSLGMLTQFFGDVPYSDAFQGFEGNVTPEYDTQQEIYATIQRLLDEAITQLAGDPGDIIPGADDLIYGGDAELWTKAAWAFKARYYMHLSEKGQDNVENALNAAQNAFTAASEGAYVPFDATQTGANPLWQFENQRSGTMVVAPFFREVMAEDPRRPVIFGPANGGFGVQNSFWSRQDSPVKLINYPEVQFIIAEAQFRLGNTSDATTALNEAIRGNFAELEIPGATYTVGSASLATVINEKYKALYPQNQAWVDYRRTGFPDIEKNPVIEQGLNPSQVIPERFIYPVDELNYNTENVMEARERQGGDLLDVTLWAFE
jgi:hypothetical protein